jgi:hypothetical protein
MRFLFVTSSFGAAMAVLMTIACSQTPPKPVAQRYEVPGRCGGIQRPWFNTESAPQGDVFIKNKLQIAQAGQFSWNGAAIDGATLERYTSQLSRMSPIELDLAIDVGAPCSVVQEVRQMLARYCTRSKCIEFTTDELTKYSARFVVNAPPHKT